MSLVSNEYKNVADEYNRFGQRPSSTCGYSAAYQEAVNRMLVNVCTQYERQIAKLQNEVTKLSSQVETLKEQLNSTKGFEH